jgi:hypothetical protein
MHIGGPTTKVLSIHTVSYVQLYKEYMDWNGNAWNYYDIALLRMSTPSPDWLPMAYDCPATTFQGETCAYPGNVGMWCTPNCTITVPQCGIK